MALEEIDYSKLKFKSGLEIHQQLDTKKKLFCNCPCILLKGEQDFEIKRKLHAVPGEKGEIDIAALHQKKLDKEFIYEGNRENSCLVELDEEPPREINGEALKIAVQLALLMNMEIVPISQIMRKTVIDGSNVSGFQRTVMIAREGYIPTSQGRVGIDYLYLEEDSARVVERSQKKEIYNLDRLGFPLVEIVTSPDIKNPEHAKEVAFKVGDILRSCKVKRGIGTIRQDVNISIRDENRVEMKGMQDMGIFIKAIENEVERQKKLSDSKKPVEMEVRKVSKDGTSKFMRPLPGSSRMYPETDLELLKMNKKFVEEVKKSLPKLREEIEIELKEKGLSKEMIRQIFKQNKLELFKELIKVTNRGHLISKMVLLFPKEIAKKLGNDLEKVEKKLEDNYNTVLYLVKNKQLKENDVKEVLTRIVEGEKIDDILSREKVEDSEIEEIILKLIKKKPGLRENAYMGMLMGDPVLKGRINGKRVMELIKRHLK